MWGREGWKRREGINNVKDHSKKAIQTPRPNPMTKHVTVRLVISCLMWRSFVGPPKLHLQLRNRTANITDTWTHSPVMVEVPITTARQRNEVASVVHLYWIAVSCLSQKRHMNREQTTLSPFPNLWDPHVSLSQSQWYGICQSSILSQVIWYQWCCYLSWNM